MDMISSILSSKVDQLPVQPLDKAKDSEQPVTSGDTKAQGTAADDFSIFMKRALGGTAKSEVNEEELFAALIEQRLEKSNPDAAESYRKYRSEFMTSMAKPDGYIPMEDVAKAALKSVVADGTLESDKAEMVNGEAFMAAQLDSNHDALYDGRGGPNDPTIATSETAAAMTGMKAMCDKIDAGEMSVVARSLDIPSNGKPAVGAGAAASGGLTPLAGSGAGAALSGEQQLDGAEGFLWKPESESDGKLVVLLPASFTGLIDKLEVHNGEPFTDETKVGEGRYANVGNGGREHYRFSETGGGYGENLYAVAFKKDGESVYWKIPNGSERLD